MEDHVTMNHSHAINTSNDNHPYNGDNDTSNTMGQGNRISMNERMVDELFRNPTVLNSLPSFSKPPAEFICPLQTSQSTMKDPVQSLSTGITYERSSIDGWRAQHGEICPVTGQPLGFLVPHRQLKERIHNWKQQVKGLRRIRRKSPTTFCLVDNNNALNCILPDHEKKLQGDAGRNDTQSGSDLINPDNTIDEGGSTSDSNSNKLPRTRPSNDQFAKVDGLLSSFVEAGISDYRHRVEERERIRRRRRRRHHSNDTSTRRRINYDNSLEDNDGENDIIDSDDNGVQQNSNNSNSSSNGSDPNFQTRYTYNPNFYPSIFSNGPRFAHSRSI